MNDPRQETFQRGDTVRVNRREPYLRCIGRVMAIQDSSYQVRLVDGRLMHLPAENLRPIRTAKLSTSESLQTLDKRPNP